jgi:hypothetical protein
MLDAIDNRTELRLQLFHNGYTPLPNVDKVCRLTGWPTVKVDEAMIRRFARSRAFQSTGLRIENGLVAIDGDITHKKLATEAWDRLIPRLALRRIGKAPKWMALVRLDGAQAPAKMRSNSWTDGLDKQQVEIFTGRQQIGAFGWHTLGERKYQWLGRSPAEVPLHSLTPVALPRLRAIVDDFDALAASFGLTKLVEADVGAKLRVYDIDEGTRFNDNQGRTGVTLAELERNYFASAHLGRAYRVASPWTGSGANVEKCLVGWSPKHDCVTVHDFPYETTHLPMSADDGRGTIVSTELIDLIKKFNNKEVGQ